MALPVRKTELIDRPTPKFEIRGQQLTLERSDIVFKTDTSGMVQLQVGIRNQSQRISPPTEVRIQAAPLGAFVSWRDVKSVQAPSLQPGQATKVSLAMPVPRTRSLGSPGGIPPRRFFDAMGGNALGQWALSFMSRKMSAILRRGARKLAGEGELPPDPMQLLDREQFHWAGNINVLIGDLAVERHRALALRVYPSTLNAAWFFVGDGTDGYRFHFEGDCQGWDPQLFNASNNESVLVYPETDKPLRESAWQMLHDRNLMVLTMVPPEECTRGCLEVHVKQRSTGQIAVVEFDLDSEAEGAGCYVV